MYLFGAIKVRSTDVSDGTEDGDFHIQLMDNGTLGDKLVIGPTTATFTDDVSIGGTLNGRTISTLLDGTNGTDNELCTICITIAVIYD